MEHEPTVSWANGGDPSFLISLGESTSGMLCPDLGCPEQERDRCRKESPEEGHRDAKEGPSPYTQVESDYLALRWKTLWGYDIIHVYSIYDGRE